MPAALFCAVAARRVAYLTGKPRFSTKESFGQGRDLTADANDFETRGNLTAKTRILCKQRKECGTPRFRVEASHSACVGERASPFDGAEPDGKSSHSLQAAQRVRHPRF